MEIPDGYIRVNEKIMENDRKCLTFSRWNGEEWEQYYPQENEAQELILLHTNGNGYIDNMY